MSLIESFGELEGEVRRVFALAAKDHDFDADDYLNALFGDAASSPKPKKGKKKPVKKAKKAKKEKDPDEIKLPRAATSWNFFRSDQVERKDELYEGMDGKERTVAIKEKWNEIKEEDGDEFAIWVEKAQAALEVKYEEFVEEHGQELFDELMAKRNKTKKASPRPKKVKPKIAPKKVALVSDDEDEGEESDDSEAVVEYKSAGSRKLPMLEDDE